MVYDDILAEIASRTDTTKNHVRTLFEDAGVESVKNDNIRYREAGLEGIIKLSPAAMQTLNAGYVKCSGDLSNLTLTTANTAQQAYITACNNAYMQISSGAFDYNTAIRNAVKAAAEDGTEVLYPSGHRDKLDVAVRRSVLTGVGQTCRQLSLINARDMGCDIMEITAHCQDTGSGIGFISTGPPQNSRMIFITLQHGCGTVYHTSFPTAVRARHIPGRLTLTHFLPGTMAFQISLIHQADSGFVAQLIPQALIWIMTGAHRIDIVFLHNLNIFAHIFLGNRTPSAGIPLMTVHTVYDQPLSIEKHQLVFDFKPAETDLIGNRLQHVIICILHKKN